LRGLVIGVKRLRIEFSGECRDLFLVERMGAAREGPFDVKVVRIEKLVRALHRRVCHVLSPSTDDHAGNARRYRAVMRPARVARRAVPPSPCDHCGSCSPVRPALRTGSRSLSRARPEISHGRSPSLRFVKPLRAEGRERPSGCVNQKECTSSPGGAISATPFGSCACAIASGLKVSRSNLISPAFATRYPVNS